MASQKQLNL